jgi:hypothetical protein
MLSAQAEPLVTTGREVLLAWPDRDGVVGLKAFRMGPQSVVALDVSLWSVEPLRHGDVSADLHAALARLKTSLG